MAGRRATRTAPDGRAVVRPEGDHDAQEPGRTPDDPARHVAVAALEEQYRRPHRAPESVVFCHPALGTPLDPSKLTATRGRRSRRRDLLSRSGRGTVRHTALTETAAAGVPGDVRAGEGRPRAGVDDGAVPARGTGRATGLGGARRGRCSPQGVGTKLSGA